MFLLEASFWQLVTDQFKNISWVEWAGTISGFACVYLAARQNIWNWPVSIISVVSYCFLFFQYKLYGDAVLQLYFLSTAIYGWYYWLKRKEQHKKPVVSFSLKKMAIVIAAIVALTGILGSFLDRFTDTDVPYADGFCTAMSFVAQFLMTRKVLQNWILWIIVDICYVPLYLYKDLMLTAILYILFLWLAVIGYLDWKKTWKTTTT
ncbi:MAG TPA: nicotinamide riboside transporter PnuC [Sphingobacteriaceae bacterium]